MCLRQSDLYLIQWCTILDLCGSQVLELVYFISCPLIRILFAWWPWLVAVAQDFVLSELMSVPYPAAVFSNVSASCWSFSSLFTRRSISSATRKLKSGRPPMDTDDSEVSTSSASSSKLSANCSFCDCSGCVKVFWIIFCNNILNSTGDNGHPCRNPTVVRKKSYNAPAASSFTTIWWFNQLVVGVVFF